ncbi:hypothetical protein D3C76_1672110 [compost metagenome]
MLLELLGRLWPAGRRQIARGGAANERHPGDVPGQQAIFELWLDANTDIDALLGMIDPPIIRNQFN